MGYGLLFYAFIEVNYIRVFFLGLFSLLLLISLFYYINKSHKLTSNFLQAILNNDFTIKYPSANNSKQLSDLYNKFNEVNEKFSQNLQHEASQYQYLLALINQLKIAVVAFDDRERVHLMNHAFMELVGQKKVINLSALKSVSEPLYEEILSLSPNNQHLVKVNIGNEIHRFSVAITNFKLRDKSYHLVSLQDIHTELDQNEMQAWQRLIRVLTHEIMNSVAPIASLSGSLETILKTEKLSAEKSLNTLLEGMEAIKVRSQGLMNFTQAYRQLAKIPSPKIQSVEAKSFFQQIETLFNSSLQNLSVQFSVKVLDPQLQLMIDPDLMQQVIINLLKNALEAVDPIEGEIILRCIRHSNSGLIQIEVSDNGNGIAEEISDQIFIPFYTTKQEGSGVGLSLAKQIVQMHGGSLGFQSSDSGTTFFIKL